MKTWMKIMIIVGNCLRIQACTLDHPKYINDDRVTIGQVFHQYGLDPSTPLTHSLFNSINSMSKLNYYKNFGVSGYRFLPNSKLSYAERELVLNANNYNDMHINEKTESKPKRVSVNPLESQRNITCRLIRTP